MEPDWQIVAARDLAEGDVIGVDYEPGSWVVESIFFEGPEVAVLDLVRIREAVDQSSNEWDLSQTEWHLLASHEVARAPRADQTGA